MARFVVQLGFIDPDRRQEAHPAHQEHLEHLLAEGRLITAGQWADENGELLIYQVADRAELNAILTADPYLTIGAAEVVLSREWRPTLP